MASRPTPFLVALVAIALLAAACGGATPDSSPAGTDAPTTEATVATTTDGGSTTTAAPDVSTTEAGPTTTLDPDRVAAPDFTLALGNGGQFVLSEEAKPVYLVFWAEW